MLSQIAYQQFMFVVVELQSTFRKTRTAVAQRLSFLFLLWTRIASTVFWKLFEIWLYLYSQQWHWEDTVRFVQRCSQCWVHETFEVDMAFKDKAPQLRYESFIILLAPLNEFEMSQTWSFRKFLPKKYYPSTGIMWSHTWSCKAKNITRLEKHYWKQACWKRYNYFLDKLVKQKWDKHLFPTMLFRGTFQLSGMWKTRW